MMVGDTSSESYTTSLELITLDDFTKLGGGVNNLNSYFVDGSFYYY